jgi:hypothetical protein
MIDARGHAKAIQFYFMQPLRPRRGVSTGRESCGGMNCGRATSARRTGFEGLRGRTLDDTGHREPNSDVNSRPLTRVCRKRLPIVQGGGFQAAFLFGGL